VSLWSISSRCTSLAEYGIEKFARRLEGRTDIEDALSRLKKLMNEESRLVAARTLDVMRRADINIQKAEECTQHFLSPFVHSPIFSRCFLVVHGRKRLSLPVSHSLP
jgi:hypothetical protein